MKNEEVEIKKYIREMKMEDATRSILDGPIGRELEKFGHVPLRLTNAQKSWMILTPIVASNVIPLKLILSSK